MRKPLAPQQTQKMIDFAVHAPRETARSIEKQGLDATGLSPGGNPLLVRYLPDLDIVMMQVGHLHARKLTGFHALYRLLLVSRLYLA